MATIKAEDTQKNILNTARKHFLKDGLTGASLRNIVKDAGLTTGAFYKYYPTKEALFDALTDPYMEHIYQIYDQIVEEFEKLSASDQTRNMSDTSSDGMEQMVDYIYDHYDNFRLLLKCGDRGKFELFIHNMVEREMKSSLKYMEKNKENRQWRIWKQKLYREKNMSQEKIRQKEKNLRRAALLQQLQEERKKLDNQIQSRSDLLKNLEASQRVDRILELYYQN